VTAGPVAEIMGDPSVVGVRGPGEERVEHPVHLDEFLGREQAGSAEHAQHGRPVGAGHRPDADGRRARWRVWGW